MIKRNIPMRTLVITDIDRSAWEDGVKLFYELSRDERPEFNPHEYFDHVDQPIYKLEELGEQFGINKCPDKVLEAINEARFLAEVYEKHIKNTLAVCLRHLTNQED